LFRDIATKLDDFVKKVAQKKGIVLEKFLKDFWQGMLSSQNVLLSEISRENKKQVLLKKQIERLSRNLVSFFDKDIIFNYHQVIKNEIHKRTIFCIDNTDIIKPCGNKFESLCQIRDGSTGNIEKGYEIINIVALSKNHKQPIPVYSNVVSYNEIDYISNNVETEKALDIISRSFGNIGVKVFDRGYDDKKLIRYLTNNKEKFVIRCKENRSLLYEGKEIKISELIKKPAKEITCYFKSHLLTYKKYPITLDGMLITLAVVSGFGVKPILLLTNLNEELEITIAKIYILRWKVEEKFRFEKQVFNIENFRVRKLKAMRNVIQLTSMLCGFIAIICEYQKSKLFKRLFQMSQTLKKKFGKNHLYFYSIARSMSSLFKIKYFSSA